MTLMIDTLITKWNSISPYQEGFLLVSEDHPLAFHIGYLGDSQKCFIVLNSGDTVRLPSSNAIKVENILLNDGTHGLRFLLNYPSLDELFIKLCWDLISVSKDSANPIDKIVDQFNKWIRLLKQVGNDLLSINSQKGLIGELLYLSDLIDIHDEVDALISWAGPEGCDQDFNLEDSWAEIKTTIISGTSIQISSIQQLDREDEGILVVYFLDKTSSHGKNTISLDEAVSNVMAKIRNEKNKFIFTMKLARSGYQIKDAEKYTSTRFKLAGKELYMVNNKFPRLTKNNIAPSIVEAQYKIALPSIIEFKILED